MCERRKGKSSGTVTAKAARKISGRSKNMGTPCFFNSLVLHLLVLQKRRARTDERYGIHVKQSIQCLSEICWERKSCVLLPKRLGARGIIDSIYTHSQLRLQR